MPALVAHQRALIERVGVLHDQLGMRPAEGRILGLLPFSAEPERTFKQIRETLDLSKSYVDWEKDDESRRSLGQLTESLTLLEQRSTTRMIDGRVRKATRTTWRGRQESQREGAE